MAWLRLGRTERQLLGVQGLAFCVTEVLSSFSGIHFDCTFRWYRVNDCLPACGAHFSLFKHCPAILRKAELGAEQRDGRC